MQVFRALDEFREGSDSVAGRFVGGGVDLHHDFHVTLNDDGAIGIHRAPKIIKLAPVRKMARFQRKAPVPWGTGVSSHPADLNCRPADYESAALPAELEWQGEHKCSNKLKKFLY